MSFQSYVDWLIQLGALRDGSNVGLAMVALNYFYQVTNQLMARERSLRGPVRQP